MLLTGNRQQARDKRGNGGIGGGNIPQQSG